MKGPRTQARISHHRTAAATDPLTVTGRTPSSRLDVASTTPALPSGPCAPSRRRLDALASRDGEKCGLLIVFKILSLLLISGSAFADDSFRVVFGSELLPEIGVISANTADAAKKPASARAAQNGSQRHLWVDRLCLEVNGDHRIGVLHYRNEQDRSRYGLGFRYALGRQHVDAIVTRNGILLKTQFNSVHMNLGFRANQDDAGDTDPAVFLMLSKSW